MKNAIIIYKSQTGTTKKFSENIGVFLESCGIKTIVKSIADADPSEIGGYDYIILGCWTNGFLLMFQHPGKEWVEFAEKLDIPDSKKIILVTTYKICTGSMFRNMCRHLRLSENKQTVCTLKSRDGQLPESQKQLLSEAICLSALHLST
ncbi:MAG TPA: flavodoxin domain-containing protein [Bacteroidales bacterium]|jgi:flavodoxin|nr:flavodoxin domain-containing protein [Bacteroidales bacterium]